MNPKIIILLNKIITFSVYLIYPLMLIGLFFTQDDRFLRVLLTPFISFAVVSLFRNHYNAPRPYEVSDNQPILSKDTKGKSFPSRHVFSVFVIAMTLFYISKPLGLSLMFSGVILAFLRVIGGVHFPKDVIAGAIIGILSGFLGFYL